MSRRALTFVLGLVLATGLALVASVQTVPYVVLSPGPAFNTLGTVGDAQVLTITGHKTYPTDGELFATTVSITDHISLATALNAWLDGSEAVVPREFVFPPDQTSQQVDQQNAQDMQQSQDDATVAAMHELGIPGKTVVSVGQVDPKGPSRDLLQAGDVITTIDGGRVTDVNALRLLITRHRVGDRVQVGFTRAGVPRTVSVVTGPAADNPARPVIGISPSTSETFPVKVTIRLQDVGGPSAGLMFALGIIDKLSPGSLTGGRDVAGTGEISTDGTVGIIGGIAQKMRGARAAGATVFLVPAGNCQEAVHSKPSGLTLVKVSTLKGAVGALATLLSGGTAPSC